MNKLYGAPWLYFWIPKRKNELIDNLIMMTNQTKLALRRKTTKQLKAQYIAIRAENE